MNDFHIGRPLLHGLRYGDAEPSLAVGAADGVWTLLLARRRRAVPVA